ncbi:MAG TPA: hypothetical protein VND92_00995 [Vicinamibacterales bacterium]|nr:hypothetical protein [Vicinamibacterales bacterium]
MLTVSKARVAGKACHVVGACVAIFLAVNVLHSLHDIAALDSGASAPPGLTFIPYFFASIFTLVVALVALLLLTVLESAALAAAVRDRASNEQRRREWRLAVIWSALPGAVILSLAIATLWWTW